MAAKKFETALIITGDGSGGSRAIKLTREQLEKLSTTGKTSQSNLKGMNTQLNTMKSRLSALNPFIGAFSIAGIGFGLSRMFTGAIEEAEKLERNLLRTEQLIISTGGAAGKTSDQLLQDARSLAFATLESTENIQNAQQIMLTFKSISGDTFTRATELAADLATVTGVDLKSSVTQLGKALEDPVKGINAMTRSGVSFTEEQKNMIKSLVETGQKAAAQKLILDELTTQYGGVARKEAEGFAGAQDTLAQRFQELKQSIGLYLIEGDGLTGFYRTLSSVALFLTEHISEVIAGVTTLGLLIAAKFVPGLVLAGAKLSLAFATNPVFLLIGAITGAVVALSSYSDAMVTIGNNSATVGEYLGATWDFVKQKGEQAWVGITEFFNESKKDIGSPDIWNAVIGFIGKVPEFAKNAVNALIGHWVGAYEAITTAFSVLPEYFKSIGSSAVNFFSEKITSGLNVFFQGLNKVLPEKLKLDLLDVSVPKAEVDEAKISLASIGAAYASAFDVDYVGDFGSAIYENIIDPIADMAGAANFANNSSKELALGALGATTAIKQVSNEAVGSAVSLGKKSKAVKSVKKALEEKTSAVKKDIAAETPAQKLRKTGLDILAENEKRVVDLTRELSGQSVVVAGLIDDENERNQIALDSIDVLNRQLDQQYSYKQFQKEVNDEIEANNILLAQGQKAYEKHIFYLKYGKDANYEFAKSQQANLDIQRKQIEAWNGVKDSMFDAITSGVDLLPELEAGIKKVTDSLLDAVAGSGSFSDVLGNVGSLYNTSGGFGGAVSSYQTGSQITSLFTDSQEAQIGGGIGTAIGSAIGGPVGGAIGNVLGSLVGGLFEGDPRITIGQDVYANDVEGSLGDDRRFSGAGFYSDATTRESAFGEFGALGSGRTKRISSEDMAGVEQALDLMVALDNSIYDLSSEAARQNVSDGLDLSHIRSDGSAEELLQERIDILLANTDSYVSALVDTSLSVEDQIARITDLAVISNDVIPALQELGFNIGDIETVTLPTAASLIELAGGLDQLDSLRSNYLDKVLSDEEKLANTRDYHQRTIDDLNHELGLTGSATISTVSGLQVLIQGLETSGALTTEVGRENLLAAYASADAFAYMRDEQNALNEQVLALNTAFTDLSSPLSLINAGLAESRQSLVDYAGGLSELNSLMSGYISSVYSADEQELIGVGQSALALQALNAELGLTGINAIDTRQELKDLFNSINNETALAVESNRELLVKLAGLGADVAAVEDSDFSSASDALAQLPADLLSVVSPLEDTVSAFDDVVNTQLPAAVEYTSEIADNINNIIAPDFSNSLQSQIDLQKESNRLAQENLAAQNRNEALLSQINSSQSQLASNSSYELGRG